MVRVMFDELSWARLSLVTNPGEAGSISDGEGLELWMTELSPLAGDSEVEVGVEDWFLGDG